LTIKAPHFALYVRDYLLEKYGEKFLTSRGLKVYTTLDFDLQTIAEESVVKGVKNAIGYDAHNGALIAINPKTGEILVMVGSKNWYGESEECEEGEGCKFDPKVNIATSLRQPGSAFKPFVYAVALQKGFTPKTIIWDVETEFNTNCPADGSGEEDEHGYDCYRPENYDEKFLGPISIRSSLAQSRNLPSVKVLYLSGIDRVLKTAKDYGISTLKSAVDYGLSLVLGGGEIRLLEMTGAYAVFANDGVKTPINFIKKIEDSKGNIIEAINTSQIRIIPSETARQINSILSDNESRAPMFGFYSLLYIPDYSVASKTGTTQYLNDAWTIGYSPSIVVGVWVGNNNNKSTEKPGVVLAGPIWRNFMNNALPKFPNEKFTEPKDITTGNLILDGFTPEEPHSILYFVNKNHPQDEGDSQDDIQYEFWEYGIQKYLNNYSLPTTN
jgi:membrane carboxypeptidase/penicillin-binding protein